MMVPRRPSARAILTILFVLIGAVWGGFLGRDILRRLTADYPCRISGFRGANRFKDF